MLRIHQVDQKPRIEITRTRRHDQSRGGRECHRRVDWLSAADSGHAGARTKMRQDHTPRRRLWSRDLREPAH